MRRWILGAGAVLVMTGAVLGSARTAAQPIAAADEVIWWDELRQEQLISLIATISALQAPPVDPLDPMFEVPDPVPSEPGDLGYVWPVRSLADVTSAFGWRLDPVGGGAQFHHGLDVRCATGEPVRAVTGGIVGEVSSTATYGPSIVVRHEYRVSSFYGHLSAVAVATGQQVRSGQVIGRCGSAGRATGAHLHLEVRFSGEPLDPLPFLAP